MKLNIRNMFTLAALLFFSGSLAFADGDKVLEVFLLKTKTGVTGDVGNGAQLNFDNVELKLPTDDEMKIARKAVEDGGFTPGDLKSVGQEIPLELFVLIVKKAKTSQTIPEKEKVNGIPVVKPTEEELGEAMVGYKQYQEVVEFINNIEFQFGVGGSPTLTDGLSHSYHTGNSLSVGLGYHLSSDFALLMNVDWNGFISSNDGRTKGFDLDEVTLELLVKYRFASKGVRPYLFAGPAVTQSDFGGSFTYQTFQGNVSYRDTSHFSMVGGLGVEIPLGRGHFFVQSELVYDWLTNDTVNFASLDSPVAFIPIEIGLVFGR